MRLKQLATAFIIHAEPPIFKGNFIIVLIIVTAFYHLTSTRVLSYDFKRFSYNCAVLKRLNNAAVHGGQQKDSLLRVDARGNFC